MQNGWELEVYDPIGTTESVYPVPGKFADRTAAENAARDKLLELNRDKPVLGWRWPSERWIAYHLYIAQPDGHRYRFLLKAN